MRKFNSIFKLWPNENKTIHMIVNMKLGHSHAIFEFINHIYTDYITNVYTVDNVIFTPIASLMFTRLTMYESFYLPKSLKAWISDFRDFACFPEK